MQISSVTLLLKLGPNLMGTRAALLMLMLAVLVRLQLTMPILLLRAMVQMQQLSVLRLSVLRLLVWMNLRERMLQLRTEKHQLQES